MDNELSYIRVPMEYRENTDGTVSVVGYVNKSNQLSLPFGNNYYERTVPGAFSNALRQNNINLLAQHQGLPLASTKSGTLKLTEDAVGLRMNATLDSNDPDVKAIIPKIKRGDLSEMSFGFNPSTTRVSFQQDGDKTIRTLEDVSLFEVSMVGTGAYPNTELKLRSFESALKEFKPKRDYAKELKDIKAKHDDLHNERFGSKPFIII